MHGRDRVTLADERARQQGTQTSTYTGAPVSDPTVRTCAPMQREKSQAAKTARIRVPMRRTGTPLINIVLVQDGR